MQVNKATGAVAKKHDPLDDIATQHLTFRERNDYFNAQTAGNPSGAKNILAMSIARAFKDNKLTQERATVICDSIGISLDCAKEMCQSMTI